MLCATKDHVEFFQPCLYSAKYIDSSDCAAQNSQKSVIMETSCLDYSILSKANTRNANMADHLVGARDELNESEASQTLMFCFDNAFSEKSCFVVDLVPLFRPPYTFLCS